MNNSDYDSMGDFSRFGNYSKRKREFRENKTYNNNFFKMYGIALAFCLGVVIIIISLL